MEAVEKKQGIPKRGAGHDSNRGQISGAHSVHWLKGY